MGCAASSTTTPSSSNPPKSTAAPTATAPLSTPMPTTTSRINTRVYAFPLSQPSRGVLWALAITKTDADVVVANPIEGHTVSPAYLARFPPGFVPALEARVDGAPLACPPLSFASASAGKQNGIDDNASDAADPPSAVVRITEAPAILTFLAEANGATNPAWEGLYPTARTPKAAAQRAVINKWLHWMHSGVRFATTEVVRPALGAIMQKRAAAAAASAGNTNNNTSSNGNPHSLPAGEAAEEANNAKAAHIEAMWKEAMYVMTASALKTTPFLAGDAVTLADIVVYCEIDQIFYGGLFDFSSFPEVAAWIERMKKVPEHDAVRQFLFAFLKDFGLLKQ